MALFNRDDENPDQPLPPSRPVMPKAASGGKSTYIGTGVKIKGEISAETEMVVDGEVHGRLQLKENLVVGSKGVVNGDIVARSVQVGGKVVGNVRGIERFELLQSGRIEGDVVSPRVVIAEGSFFKGNVEMAAEPAPSVPTPGPQTATKPSPPAGQPTGKPEDSQPGSSAAPSPEKGGPK